MIERLERLPVKAFFANQSTNVYVLCGVYSKTDDDAAGCRCIENVLEMYKIKFKFFVLDESLKDKYLLNVLKKHFCQFQ